MIPRPVKLSIELRTGAIAGAGIYETESSDHRPALLLIPGVNGSSELFSTLAPRLAAKRKIIAVDLGERVAHGAGVIESAVDDVREILEEIDPGTVDLLGQSFGSIVAVRLWRFGGVRRLVLAPPAIGPRGGWVVYAEWLAKAGLIRLWPASMEGGLRKLLMHLGGYTPEPGLGEEELRRLIRRVREVSVRPLLRRVSSLRAHSWQREMEGVTAPVLVIEGEKERVRLPPEALAVFDERRNCSVAVVRGGHMPFLSHPEEFQELVSGFLDGV